MQEVEELINFGFKEFFDDSGTFPVGKWFHEFCNEMIERGYNKHIKWGCNMRFHALKPEDFKLMQIIYAELYRNGRIFNMDEVMGLLRSRPELAEINAHVTQRS